MMYEIEFGDIDGPNPVWSRLFPDGDIKKPILRTLEEANAWILQRAEEQKTKPKYYRAVTKPKYYRAVLIPGFVIQCKTLDGGWVDTDEGFFKDYGLACDALARRLAATGLTDNLFRVRANNDQS